jgi:hypothetical protein
MRLSMLQKIIHKWLCYIDMQTSINRPPNPYAIVAPDCSSMLGKSADTGKTVDMVWAIL